MVARYGGEEFVVIMPDAAPEAAAMVAERLRQRIDGEAFHLSDPDLPDIHVTISLGVAATDEAEYSPDALIKRADECLYEAKHNGRNCVVVDRGDGPDVYQMPVAM